jgi:UDP-2,3-diacylglucosamine pyrophosphatase LpxH
LELGTEINYITGNHDDRLRRHSGVILGGLSLKDSLQLNIDGKEHLFLHGDMFDMIVQNNRWISILGGYSYDLLILLNRLVNKSLTFFGKEPMSFSKKVKNSVKGAIKFINNFEQTVVEYAKERDIDTVVCGHIHQPKIKTYVTDNAPITYLNSGDWVENCTALEYQNKKWELYQFKTKLPKKKKMKVL